MCDKKKLEEFCEIHNLSENDSLSKISSLWRDYFSIQDENIKSEMIFFNEKSLAYAVRRTLFNMKG